jgi:hypothetical protein
VQDILQQETRADEHDAKLEPELVRCDAGAENLCHAERVRDQEPENDGPEDVLDLWEAEVVLDAEHVKRVFEELAKEADAEEERHAGKDAGQAHRFQGACAVCRCRDG